MAESSAAKERVRQAIWDRLQREGLARFPFPPHGRIPNFAGAKEAARRLFELSPWKEARRLKVNPDSPQRYVREEALRRGITVFVPTPRLRGGFKRLDPAKIPADKISEAARLSKAERWSVEVNLEQLPEMDAIVTGAVAVTREGHRCGKGGGYGDLEYAILRELGHPPVLVATTVHDFQIVDSLPCDPTDLPISVIVTPEEAIKVASPPAPPTGIDWDRLSEKDLTEMPILKELRERTAAREARARGGAGWRRA